MNPEIKQKWTTALTDGSFKQGQQRLRRGDTYCCLGVLAELYAKATGLAKWKISEEVPVETDQIYYIAVHDSAGDIVEKSTHYLPVPIQEWAGLKEEYLNDNQEYSGGSSCQLGKRIPNPYYDGASKKDKTFGNLAMANDGGFTFEEIAQLINENL